MASQDDDRIRRLMDQASRDLAAGRAGEAERGLSQAVAEAPGHPLVVGELARRRLAAGDPRGAVAMLEAAVKAEPGHAELWLALAAASSRLGRSEAEMEALEKALAIQPSHLQALLQSASLLARRGDSRASAAVYRTAMQTIPAGAEIPPQLRPVLQQAKAVIDANNRDLEAFLQARFRTLRARHGGERLGRFDRAMETLLLQRRVYRPQPSFLYFPQLPAIEFYERDEFPWLDRLEAASDDIRAELMGVLADGGSGVEPYVSVDREMVKPWRELNNSLRWGAYFMWREGVAYRDNIARCPRTMAALDAWPRCDMPNCSPTAMFSILEPKTRIPPHTGVNNCRLVVHLPLVVPPGCGFRVGAETRAWRPGEAFVFDDTIEHEAWNDGDEWRAVLILDIWNPYLTAAEREMVCALTEGVEAFYGRLPPYVSPIQRGT